MKKGYSRTICPPAALTSPVEGMIEMAMKYHCDGCDKEVIENMLHRISVSVKRNGETSAAGGAYELCKSCADQLTRDSNPKNWTRVARPKP